MLKDISFCDRIALLFGLLVVLVCNACSPLTLDEELEEAKSAWNVIEMCPAQVYEVDQITLDIIADVDARDIPEGGRLQGYADRSTCEIWIRSRLPWDRRARVLEHELGHLIRGKAGHLDCLDQPGDDLMCPDGGGPWLEGPTDRDVAFVKSR
jgi:hypothetical protein